MFLARSRKLRYGLLVTLIIFFFFNIGSVFGWYYLNPVQLSNVINRYYLRQQRYNFRSNRQAIIELQLDRRNATSILTHEFGAQDGLSGSNVWWVRNTGNATGRLSVTLDAIRSFENGCNESERAVDSSCSDPGENQGEFEGVVIMTPVVVRRSLQVQLESFLLNRQAGQSMTEVWFNHFDQSDRWVPILRPRTELGLQIDWYVDPRTINASMQSDSVEFVLEFTLDQVQ